MEPAESAGTTRPSVLGTASTDMKEIIVHVLCAGGCGRYLDVDLNQPRFSKDFLGEALRSAGWLSVRTETGQRPMCSQQCLEQAVQAARKG